MVKTPRASRIVRASASVLALLFVSAPLRATSVVFDVNPNGIYVLADSRAGEETKTSNTTHDDKCKIAVLGNQILFSETGSEGYTPEGILDTVPGWHGLDEAQAAYRNAVSHRVHDVALQWATQVTINFQKFYIAAPDRVRGLAVYGTLLVGLFGGFENGKSVFYFARIAVDDSLISREATTIPVGYSLNLVPDPKPYATDGITQELIDGKTDRAKKAAALWATKRQKVAPADRRWRWLEFMVEQTTQYDDTVYPPVNVVQITPNRLTWIQNKTCRDARE